jgi:hypothetical protein
MEKNEIINTVVTGLLSQRAELVDRLSSINYSDNNSLTQKQDADMAISNIDMQINQMIVNCESDRISAC